MAAGNAIGIPITEDEAIKWLTINPAWALGLDEQDRLARARQERRRRALVRRSVQRLHARREGLDRRRACCSIALDPAAAVAHRLRAWLRAGNRKEPMKCIQPRDRVVAARARDRSSRPRCRSRPDDRDHRRQGLSGQRSADRKRHRAHSRPDGSSRSDANVAVPAGAQRIDATGKMVTPGFVNAPTHARAAGRSARCRDTRDERAQGQGQHRGGVHGRGKD